MIIHKEKRPEISPPPPQQLNKRNAVLDGIRGIAALIVAVPAHYYFYLPNSPFTSSISVFLAVWGRTMVEIFFMLSGFIFFNKYGAKISSRSISKKDFFILRFSRLYPLHWLTLLVVAIVQLVRKYVTGSGFFEYYYIKNIFLFLQNILCVQNGWLQTSSSFNGPAWSISIEIMMYIIFYALFYYVGSGKKRLYICLFLIYLGVMMHTSGWEKPLFNVSTGRGLICFFTGVLIGEILSREKNIKRERQLISASVLTVILSLALIFILFKYNDKSGIYYMYGYLVCMLALFPALFILSLRLRILSKALSLKPLLYLGEISYSMYLTHFPIVLIITTLDKIFNLKIDYSSYMIFFAYTAAVIIISHIVHFYFEKPLQNYIRRESGIRVVFKI
ncbi:MAG: acyltransferase [Treponema sp.]|jgi:peptidoglycan/LPS O-acetylase OafA/YrhL|nr:acyltransferase [Treponema sp.]